MFYNNSKVIVIQSNVKRKSGPRQGSIGYVTHVDKTMYKLSDNYSWLNVGVLFYRYGHEEQPRREIKYIKHIIPRQINPKTDPKKFVTRLMKGSTSLKDSTRDIVVLAPLNVHCNLNAIDTDQNEIFAYLLSVLSSSFLKSVFGQMLCSNGAIRKVGDTVSPELTSFLVRITKNKFKLQREKYAVLCELFHDKKISNEFIHLVHNLNSKIMINNKLRVRNKAPISHLATPGFIRNLMYKNMFMDATYNKLKTEVIALNKDIKVIKHMDRVKQALVSKGSQIYLNS
jgi:hypothetical protein